jgi:hypothetical protein
MADRNAPRSGDVAPRGEAEAQNRKPAPGAGFPSFGPKLGDRRPYSTLAGILTADISGRAIWLSNWSAFSSSDSDLVSN